MCDAMRIFNLLPNVWYNGISSRIIALHCIVQRDKSGGNPIS